jgi:beta-N-acetylhexosaminidase
MMGVIRVTAHKEVQVVDLSAQPFNLSQEDIAWVRQSIEEMTLDDKVGQLFINLNVSFDERYLDHVVDRYRVGGLRYRGADSQAIQDHIRHVQERSSIPLLVASNPEMGGFGSADDGTLVCTHLQAGSHPDSTIAYDMGRIAGREISALGCNWAFAPIVDIHLNWRNTVVATRSFGDDAALVAERAGRFFDGISESGVACAIKHFPGDGVDERDQHVTASYNTLDYSAWDATYGRVYRDLIARGVQSIMVGHIGAPLVSREFRPELTDEQIMPATLAPELLGDLLRGRLGFNGLIVTDASAMAGLTHVLPRRDLVPATIAAGCDMFLFMRNADEDVEYMRAGIESGVITSERLQSALERILGLKASLGLHRKKAEGALVPPADALGVIGSAEHHRVAAEVADKTITLVKDTRSTLPLTPATHPRIRLYGVSADSDFTGADPRRYLQLFREELEAAGFDVHVFRTLAERIADGEQGVFFHTVMHDEANAQYAEKYDAAILVANVTGFAQESTIRLRWSAPMAAEIPWYTTEVPTIFVSTALPTHLIDVPWVRTVIHAHAPSRENIRATVEKIQGLSPFRGTFNDKVWCNTYGTRL